MSQRLLQTSPIPTTTVWCGRSWEGLVDRRVATFAQAQALRGATERSSGLVVGDFLEFFNETGTELFRDEEEWIFRSLRPTPHAVIRALEEHIQISELITSLLREAEAGCVDLRVVHGLGVLLEEHLLSEEEHLRPLVSDRPRLILAP
jgi:hypothetical protein